MKRHAYPHFAVIGLVAAYENGSSRPDFEIKAGCFISYNDESFSALVRDAKWKLERLGVPKERIDTLYFDGWELLELRACNAIGVRRDYGDHVEAFLDANDLKKRDVLIRQRRLIPHDHSDMLAIYGPKVATPAQEGVAA